MSYYLFLASLTYPVLRRSMGALQGSTLAKRRRATMVRSVPSPLPCNQCTPVDVKLRSEELGNPQALGALFLFAPAWTYDGAQITDG